MKSVKIIRGFFAGLLVGLWGIYGVVNLVDRLPYLRQGIREAWDFASVISYTMDAANSGVAFQETIQDAGSYLRLVQGRKTDSLFNMIQSDDGQFCYFDFYPYVSYDFSRQALQLKQVQAAAQDNGAVFLYFNVIDQNIRDLDTFAGLPVSNLNSRADAFLDALNGYGLETLDSRTVLAASELPPEQYRYRTGPLWTTQAGFEIYLGLVETLKSRGVTIDEDGFYTNRDHFRKTVYQNGYVGETGKQMGIPMAGYEDFTLIEPDFATDFVVDYRHTNHRAIKRGDFSETIIDKFWIENENPYERNMYAAYLTGDYPLRIIRNEQNPDGPKILIVGDSYMLPVVSFLATAAGEVYLLWPYTLPGTGTFVDYINSVEFDSVIIGLAPDLLKGSGFNYLDGIEPEQAEPDNE